MKKKIQNKDITEKTEI